jgi:Glycosyl transferase family 2
VPIDAPAPGADSPQVTVIIPTVADERRGETIWRTIESAGPASGARTRVLVVVNGKRFSPALLAQLRDSPAVDCLYIEQGNLPLALKSGREAVRSEYFAFIDDDDEFLPGGLATRVQALQARPDAAFLVSQGWFHSAGRDEPQTGLSAAAIQADPLACLLRENWVATSASGLYRTDRITPEDFAGMPSYLEWTYLGFRLVPHHPFVFIDTPTYRRHDMPGSVSKSAAYCRGMVSALSSILRLDLPPATRQGLRRKLASATHDLSVLSLEQGERREAWRQHLRSLALPGGWHYLGYTRHLLSPQPSAS